MKKTHKKIFGLFGLVLVVAVTIFAAFLPGPKTQAVDITEVVDTIKVRVVGSTPAVSVAGITANSTVTSASQNLVVTYENIKDLNLKLQYTDVDGNVYEEELFNAPVEYVAGVSNVSINLKTGEYTYDYQTYDAETESVVTVSGLSGWLTNCGYGEYVLTASGSSIEGATAEDIVNFKYLPVDASITEEDGVIDVDLDYDADDGTGDGEVAKIVITIKDEDGNVIKTVEVTPPTKNVQINLADEGILPGKYVAEIAAYNSNGEQLYKTLKLYFEYKGIPVPDTGGMMGNLNISKTDYVITGLIIFSVVGISGAVFIARHDKKTGNGRRR